MNFLQRLGVSAVACVCAVCAAGRDLSHLDLSMVHRGDGKLVPGRVNRPDNSLEACLLAWANRTIPEADIRTTKEDPFCPSSVFLKDAVARLHAAGKIAAGFPWTHGDDPEMYRRLWALGFDCFGTDYPEVMNRVIAELRTAR